MTDAILKGVSAILFVAVLFLAGMYWRDLHTIDDLSARNERLSASLKAIDLKAQSDQQTYKENLDAIKDKAKRDRAAIDAYYRRLLSQTGDRAGPSNPPQNPTAMDTGCSQQTLSGCPAEVERRCVADALTVGEMVEFFRVNKFPVGD
jgi:hypothetical protein